MAGDEGAGTDVCMVADGGTAGDADSGHEGAEVADAGVVA